jgi:hypothetical protein
MTSFGAWVLYDNSETVPAPARLGREPMNPKPIEQAKSPLLARTLPALLAATDTFLAEPQ